MLIPGAAMFSIGVFVVVSTSFVLISPGPKSMPVLPAGANTQSGFDSEHEEKQAEEFEVNFAEKLKLSMANPAEQQSVENQDQAQIIQPQFASILGDTNIHEKYNK